jgi:hypothetical protein
VELGRKTLKPPTTRLRLANYCPLKIVGKHCSWNFKKEPSAI